MDSRKTNTMIFTLWKMLEDGKKLITLFMKS